MTTIGSMQEFQEGQLSKVERRKKEEERIKKGIYQMQVMLDCQNTETFDKESKKSKERTEISREGIKKAEGQKREYKKADIHTEMKRMMPTVDPMNLFTKA